MPIDPAILARARAALETALLDAAKSNATSPGRIVYSRSVTGHGTLAALLPSDLRALINAAQDCTD